ncbi:MAG: N-formylglutamate amidohydrolase [Chloroflexi bacterium]|nr:N-formylglutamate amidohydrolase [Chloroflexota bacterium]
MGAQLPIAIISAHGGLAIPPELNGRLAITPEQIFNEADAYVDELFDFRDQVLYWVTFPYARAILDMNRPAEPSLHHRPGDAVVKVKTSYGDPVFIPGAEPDETSIAQLVTDYWDAWQQQLAAIAADSRVKLVIDAHTMAGIGPGTYDDPHALRPRVMAANMGDHFGELVPARGKITAAPALTNRFVTLLGEALQDVVPLMETGALTAVNTPYFGGWNLAAHGGIHQPWLMVEISRALYLGPQTGDTPILTADPERLAAIRRRIWDVLVQFVAEISYAA